MSERTEREALYSAAINCPHEIDSNRIVLHHDPKQPGHNALAQLGNRLAAAIAAHSEHAHHMVEGAAAGPMTLLQEGIECMEARDMDDCDWVRRARALLAAQPAADAAPAPVAAPASELETCKTCQGNGEIVTDWDRYKHPHDGDKGDEAVAECADCDGTGAAAPLAESRQGVALSEETTQPWYDAAWEAGASRSISFAGDELESLTFTPKEFEAFCNALSRASSSRAEVEIPEEYVLVPKVPTDAMLDATRGPGMSPGTWNNWAKKRHATIYRQMLAAAEAPNAGEKDA